MGDNIVERLERSTPYGLDDKTVLTDAKAEIKRLRSELDAERNEANLLMLEIQRLRAAGNALVALIDGSIEWDTPHEESRADGAIAAWEEARRG